MSRRIPAYSAVRCTKSRAPAAGTLLSLPALLPFERSHAIKPIGTVEGSVVDVKVFIDDAGNVTRAQALEKGGELTGAALNAARQWRFTPARKHNKPVSSEMLLHFRF